MIGAILTDDVRQFDNHLRYLVKSRSRKTIEHLVQLDSYNSNGSCGCEGFHYHHEPLLKANARPCDGLRCWHIRRVREVLLDVFVSQLKAIETKGGETAERKAIANRKSKNGIRQSST